VILLKVVDFDYLPQLPFTFIGIGMSLILFAIVMASAIIMVLFICLICELASAILAIPDICGGIGLFSGFFIMQR
jgi:hypothetical protein